MAARRKHVCPTCKQEIKNLAPTVVSVREIAVYDCRLWWRVLDDEGQPELGGAIGESRSSGLRVLRQKLDRRAGKPDAVYYAVELAAFECSGDDHSGRSAYVYSSDRVASAKRKEIVTRANQMLAEQAKKKKK